MNRHTLSALLACAALSAAGRTPGAGAATKSPAPTSSSHGRPAASQKHADILPFIEDDYGRAVAEAKARKVPLFVEAWAPW